MNERWIINRTNPEYISYISNASSVSPAFAQVLINRGIKTPDDINDFLHPSAASFSDPFDLPDIHIALERIKAALDRSERVLIHGDYDADGLTATAIMFHALRAIGIDAHYFIPDRMAHGYGFNPPAVDMAKRSGVKLIITVDCGISSFDAASCAKREGIDVIITDHHEPVISNESPATRYLLPEALAIINPKLGTRSSKLANLSGAGIAFKIAQSFSLDNELRFTGDDSIALLDLAVLGTIADVVPLRDENRVIVSEGMKRINNAHRPGIRALRTVSGFDGRELRAGLLSFTMIPRINAAGRIGDTADVMKLFLSDSDGETISIADKLQKTNIERQQLEEKVYQEALSQLNEKGYDSAIVLCNKGWHIGVIGIVASRIAEEFFRPAFVFSLDNEIAKGSARSIPSFDIYKGLSECKDILLSFGGHKQAAGVKLHVSNLSGFEEMINAVIKEAVGKDDFIPTIEIDAEVALSDVNTGLIKELSMLEPLGYGNPEPLLGARRLDIVNPRIVGNNHLKLRLKQMSMSIDAIGFDMGNLLGSLGLSVSVDAAFMPAINEWNGNRYMQLNLKAFRPSV
jgi:single-stranded-DNA-specific exonuclease